MEAITVTSSRIQYPYIESVRDQGFGQSGVCRNFKTKNEDTWYKVLVHFDAEYDTAQRVFNGW